MKREKVFKRNQQGSSHLVLLMLVVVGVGIFGAYQLMKSHADVQVDANAVAADDARATQAELQTDPGFTGVSIDDSGTVHVYGKNLGQASKDKVKGKHKKTNYAFQEVAHSKKELAPVKTKVEKDLDLQQANGVKPASVGINSQTGLVELAVEDDSPAVKKFVQDHYGSDVQVVKGEIAKPSLTRLTDDNPWTGGDILHTYDSSGNIYGGCTSGPAVVTSSGAKRILTAGHCYIKSVRSSPSGLTDYKFRTVQNFDGPRGTNTGTMGYAAAKYDNHGYDVAMIAAPANGHVWRTQYLQGTAGTRGPQVGGKPSVVGERVCASGALSGENCAYVTKVDYSQGVYAPSGSIYYTIHASLADTKDGSTLAGDGDSGAAVYYVGPNGGLSIRGVLFGVMANRTCPQISTTTYGGTRHCGSQAVYEEITPLNISLGVHLLVL
jgi:hypothetical protein